jgi:hypothetical protein
MELVVAAALEDVEAKSSADSKERTQFGEQMAMFANFDSYLSCSKRVVKYLLL